MDPLKSSPNLKVSSDSQVIQRWIRFFVHNSKITTKRGRNQPIWRYKVEKYDIEKLLVWIHSKILTLFSPVLLQCNVLAGNSIASTIFCSVFYISRSHFHSRRHCITLERSSVIRSNALSFQIKSCIHHFKHDITKIFCNSLMFIFFSEFR